MIIHNWFQDITSDNIDFKMTWCHSFFAKNSDLPILISLKPIVKNVVFQTMSFVRSNSLNLKNKYTGIRQLEFENIPRKKGHG